MDQTSKTAWLLGQSALPKVARPRERPAGKLVEWAGAALSAFSGDQVAGLWVVSDIDGLRRLLEANAQY